MAKENSKNEARLGYNFVNSGANSRVSEFIADPRKAVWKLSFPVMLGMAVQTIYSFTDMIFVGRLGGDAIAALTFNMPLGFFTIGIMFGFGVGVTSAVARLLGANDKAGADNAASHAILFGVFFGLLIPAAGIYFKTQIFTLLGVPEKVIPGALSYFEIIAPGFIFSNLSVQFRSIMTGEGDTRTPIVIQISGTVLNLILDPLLIFVAGWGLEGAAWATFISQLFVLLIFLYHFFIRGTPYVSPTFRGFVYDGAIFKQILQIGIPASLSMLIMSIGNMFWNRLVANFGAEAVAAYGVGGRLDSVYFLPTFALASGMVTLTGMFYGAGRLDLIRETVCYVLIRGQILALGFGGIFYFFSPSIFTLFTSNDVIISMAVDYIRTIVFAFPFITLGVISGRIFQGLGEGMPSLVLTAMRVIFVSGTLAFVFIYVMKMGLWSIWLALALGATLTSITALSWLFLRLRELERNVVTTQKKTRT